MNVIQLSSCYELSTGSSDMFSIQTHTKTFSNERNQRFMVTMKVVRTYISMFSAKCALHRQQQPNQLTQLHEIKTIKVKMATHSLTC